MPITRDQKRSVPKGESIWCEGCFCMLRKYITRPTGMPVQLRNRTSDVEITSQGVRPGCSVSYSKEYSQTFFDIEANVDFVKECTWIEIADLKQPKLRCAMCALIERKYKVHDEIQELTSGFARNVAGKSKRLLELRSQYFSILDEETDMFLEDYATIISGRRGSSLWKRITGKDLF
jgi:hypothetical protein